MRKTVSLAALNGGRILLVRKNQTWILPGGKPADKESDAECLLRECREELPEAECKIIRYYSAFKERIPHKKGILEDKVYLGELSGNTEKISAEIQEAKWFFYRESHSYKLSEITKNILEYMKKKRYF